MAGKQVGNEALTLLIAGHETTANALTWAWSLLSKNPEAEARMQMARAEGSRPVDDMAKLP